MDHPNLEDLKRDIGEHNGKLFSEYHLEARVLSKVSFWLPVSPVGIGFGVDIATPLPATRPNPGPGVIFGTLGKPASHHGER